MVVGEFLQRLSHGSDIEGVPGILMSQFLGMKNVEELKSVCTCKASLKFLGIKRNPSHLAKHSSELPFTCIRGRISSSFRSAPARLVGLHQREQPVGTVREWLFKNIS